MGERSSQAIRREFPTHAHNFVVVSDEGIHHATKKVDNQLIERYHATFRERDKVIRGFKSESTANTWIGNWRTYYNFVKPHMSLNGLTPAQEAGIAVGLERNRWLSLLKLSVTQPL